MAKKRPPYEPNQDKAGGGAIETDFCSADDTTMKRFNHLAKGLLGVSREQLREEQERYNRQKKASAPEKT